jgi:hypothetical protein
MRRLIVLVSLSLAAACAPSREDLGRLMAEAAACDAGDSCGVAGQSKCTCGGSAP